MIYDILCSPNISEGRSKEVIDTCGSAISSVDGVILIDVDSSPTNNRTVFNFVGNSSSIIEAALNLSRAAYNLIDISKHKGYQPRLGVISACPFVPVKNEDINKCVEVANEFAIKLAEEVVAPVYIYGDNITDEARKTVIEELFVTEYEDLEDKILKDELKPDFGVAEFVPQWGATLVGARKFLVYFNINLLGTKEQAMHIATKLEELYNKSTEKSKNEDIQCAGWFSDELNVAQISINIMDFEKTPIHEIFKSSENIAREVNASVIGSQIVGAVPLNLLLYTAEQIMESEKLLLLDDDQKIRLVIGKLGLNSLSPFNPKEKIIEYIVEASEESSGNSSTVSLENALLNLTLGDFIQAVAARNSTPGLGSVASLVSILGTSLATMGGLLSYGMCNQIETEQNGKLRKLIPEIHKISKKLLPFIDKHALLAFEYSKISSFPSDTDKDKHVKKEMEMKSLERCLECSRQVGEMLSNLWSPLLELSDLIDSSRFGELKLAGSCIVTALEGLQYLISTYPEENNGKVKSEIEKYTSDSKIIRQKLEENCSKKK